MNKYFCSIGKTLQEGLPRCGDEYKTYLPERTEHTLFLFPCDDNELARKIKALNPKKACGADNIGAKLIQTFPDIFAQNLTVIFNRAMQDGEYPAQMKIAKVIALYKKCERYKANNYRPISLLSCFNKIFERLLSKRLIKCFDDNNLIFKFQFGYRKLYSTTLALIEFTDSIRGFLDDGNYAISIFIDLTKAFDTVDHEILLHKLDSYGIRGHVNNFFLDLI